EAAHVRHSLAATGGAGSSTIGPAARATGANAHGCSTVSRRGRYGRSLAGVRPVWLVLYRWRRPCCLYLGSPVPSGRLASLTSAQDYGASESSGMTSTVPGLRTSGESSRLRFVR